MTRAPPIIQTAVGAGTTPSSTTFTSDILVIPGLEKTADQAEADRESGRHQDATTGTHLLVTAVWRGEAGPRSGIWNRGRFPTTSNSSTTGSTGASVWRHLGVRWSSGNNWRRRAATVVIILPLRLLVVLLVVSVVGW